LKPSVPELPKNIKELEELLRKKFEILEEVLFPILPVRSIILEM